MILNANPQSRTQIDWNSSRSSLEACSCNNMDREHDDDQTDSAPHCNICRIVKGKNRRNELLQVSAVSRSSRSHRSHPYETSSKLAAAADQQSPRSVATAQRLRCTCSRPCSPSVSVDRSQPNGGNSYNETPADRIVHRAREKHDIGHCPAETSGRTSQTEHYRHPPADSIVETVVDDPRERLQARRPAEKRDGKRAANTAEGMTTASSLPAKRAAAKSTVEVHETIESTWFDGRDHAVRCYFTFFSSSNDFDNELLAAERNHRLKNGDNNPEPTTTDGPPTVQPTFPQTVQPTYQPTSLPTVQPTSLPTVQPTSPPTVQPTSPQTSPSTDPQTVGECCPIPGSPVKHGRYNHEITAKPSSAAMQVTMVTTPCSVIDKKCDGSTCTRYRTKELQQRTACSRCNKSTTMTTTTVRDDNRQLQCRTTSVGEIAGQDDLVGRRNELYRWATPRTCARMNGGKRCAKADKVDATRSVEKTGHAVGRAAATAGRTCRETDVRPRPYYFRERLHRESVAPDTTVQDDWMARNAKRRDYVPREFYESLDVGPDVRRQVVDRRRNVTRDLRYSSANPYTTQRLCVTCPGRTDSRFEKRSLIASRGHPRAYGGSDGLYKACFPK